MNTGAIDSIIYIQICNYTIIFYILAGGKCGYTNCIIIPKIPEVKLESPDIVSFQQYSSPSGNIT